MLAARHPDLVGRLMVVDEKNVLTRLDPAGQYLAQQAGFDWVVGQQVGGNEFAGFVIAVGIVGQEHAQPVLDGQAGCDLLGIFTVQQKTPFRDSRQLRDRRRQPGGGA